MAFSPSTLGGSNGKAPIIFGAMDGGNERALARKYLSKAFGNMNNSGLNSSPHLELHLMLVMLLQTVL
jgi:hypothetical protein